MRRRIVVLCLLLHLHLGVCEGRPRLLRVASNTDGSAAAFNQKVFVEKRSPVASRNQHRDFVFDGGNCICECNNSVNNAACVCECENKASSRFASIERTKEERRRLAEAYQMQLDEEELLKERRQFFSRALQYSMSLSMSLPAQFTFGEIIDADPDFSNLSQAFDAIQYDIGAFENNVTLFAPNNGAFAKLDPAVLEMFLSPQWSAHLDNILRTHVVDGAIRSSALVNGELKARNGDILTVSVGENIYISAPGTKNATVTLPETVSADGVFYELNDVLLPDFVSTTVLDILETTPDLSIFNDLLMQTGLDRLFASRRMIQAITEVTGNTFTVFAPNDDAFNALGTEAMTYYRTNMSATTTLLLGHVVLDQVVSTRALDAGPVVLTSAAGDTLTFMSDFKDDGEPVYTVNDVEIVMTDVLANDGIVQVISSVLDVPRADPPEFSSDWPSSTPSQRPSITPSQRPSVTPSTTPSSIPSQAPSVAPSQEPSSHPVSLEVVRPTPRPTVGVVAPSPGPGKGSKSKKGGYNIR
jgi:uncharacterized surface protein with fasciclin (FAS1) repeats